MYRAYISAANRAAYEANKKNVYILAYNTVDEARDGSDTFIDIIENDDVMENSLTVDRYCTTADTIEFGSAVASELNFKLYNKDGRFDDIDFSGKVLRVIVEASGASVSVPLGVFIVDDVTVDSGIIALKGLDYLTVLDIMVGKTYAEYLSEHDDIIIDYEQEYHQEHGIVTFTQGTLGWLLYHVLNDTGFGNVSEGGDVYPEPYLWASVFPNDIFSFVDHEITDIPNMKNMTYRSILMNLCALAGVCAYANDTQIALTGYNDNDPQWYYGERFEISSAQRYEGNINRTELSFGGITLTTPTGYGYYPYRYVSDTSTYLKIETGITIPDVNLGVPVSYVSSLWDSIYLPNYYPFEAKILSAPYLYPLDIISYVDGENTYTCLITHVTITINGPTYISGKEKPYNDGNTDSDYAWQGSQTGQSFAMLEDRVSALEQGGGSSDHYTYMIGSDGVEYKGMLRCINGKPYYEYEEA